MKTTLGLTKPERKIVSDVKKDGWHVMNVLPERDEPAGLGPPRRLDPVHRSRVPGERRDRASGRAAGGQCREHGEQERRTGKHGDESSCTHE